MPCDNRTTENASYRQRDMAAMRLHNAARAFLAALSTGGIGGDDATIPRRALLEHPLTQALSDAAGACLDDMVTPEWIKTLAMLADALEEGES